MRGSTLPPRRTIRCRSREREGRPIWKMGNRRLCTCAFGVGAVHEAGRWCWLPRVAYEIVAKALRQVRAQPAPVLTELLHATTNLRLACDAGHYYQRGVKMQEKWTFHSCDVVSIPGTNLKGCAWAVVYGPLCATVAWNDELGSIIWIFS